MDSVKIVENVLTKKIVDHIKLLVKNLDFIIASDVHLLGINRSGLGVFEGDHILQGMSRNTLDNRNINDNNRVLYTRLNDMGIIITELVCKRLDIKYKRIDRLMWNFYKPGEKGIEHIDVMKEGGDFISILYSLNTSDGYIKIKNKKIYDVEDEAKVFNSRVPHQGMGPKKTNHRLNLNIVVET